MTALLGDRATPMMGVGIVATRAAGGFTFFAGAIVMLNAAGFACPGKTATGLTYWGCAEDCISTVGKADGEITITVRRDKAFKWNNFPTDVITQASVGQKCYVVDDQTVAATSGANTRSQAGTVIAVDAGGVWVCQSNLAI